MRFYTAGLYAVTLDGRQAKINTIALSARSEEEAVGLAFKKWREKYPELANHSVVVHEVTPDDFKAIVNSLDEDYR